MVPSTITKSAKKLLEVVTSAAQAAINAVQLPEKQTVAPPQLHRNYIGGLARGFGGSVVHTTSTRFARELSRYINNRRRCDAIRAGTFKRERQIKREARARALAS